MAKSSSYTSKVPDARGIIAYDAQENAVWRDLMARQEKLLPGRVCGAFLKGLDILDLPRDRVPQLKDVDARLQEATGFGVAPVPATYRRKSSSPCWPSGNFRRRPSSGGAKTSTTCRNRMSSTRSMGTVPC